MASNYSNYFFSIKTDEYAYDEYVYGRNSYTGSCVMASNNDPWNPITGSTITRLASTVARENYAFSPKAYGNFRDMFYSPPSKYVYSADDLYKPLIKISGALSYSSSLNTDQYSRISTRFRDR